MLTKLGKAVTVLEAQAACWRVLARVAAEPLSRFHEAEHCGHGVDIRLGGAVYCIGSRAGAAPGVRRPPGDG